MPAMPVPADGEARLGAPGPPAAPGSRQGSWPLSYLWLLGTLLRAKNHGNKRFKKKHLPESKRRRCFRGSKIDFAISVSRVRCKCTCRGMCNVHVLFCVHVSGHICVSPSALHPPTGVVPSLPLKGSTCSLFAFWIIFGYTQPLELPNTYLPFF